MFLYTICPGCQAGYDVTDLLRGKKIRCKSCSQPFLVTATPRPRHLPAPAPFARPQSPAPESGFAAQPLPAFAAVPPPNLAAMGKPGRPVDRLPRPAQRPSPISNAGSWLGRGGIGGLIVLFVVIRGCAAIMSRPAYTPPPPMVMPQHQWKPGNGWPGAMNPNGIDPWQQPNIQPVQPPNFKFDNDFWKKFKQPGGVIFPNKGNNAPRRQRGNDARIPEANRRDQPMPPRLNQETLPPSRKDQRHRVT